MTSWPNQEALIGHGLKELEAEMKRFQQLYTKGVILNAWTLQGSLV
jgi:hypothetical protein